MKPPIASPDENPEAEIKPVASFSPSYCWMAMLGAVVLVWMIKRTIFWCTPDAACAACQFAGMELIFAPTVLTLPFYRIMSASGLNPLGVVARCAVIGGIVVWGSSFVYLMVKSAIP